MEPNDGGQVALVTGGSRGIGAATCVLLAEQGYDVMLSYVQDDNAALRVCKTIQQKGRRAIAMQADVGKAKSIEALFQRCEREFGGLTALVNNAGIVGGNIVNVSSVASRLGSPTEYVDYAASKGAVDVLTLGLAKEVANEGIRVNAVRRGIINTDIHASGGQPDRVAQFAPLIPMQRGGHADEVAAAIVWLLSDSARYVTGSTLDVAGGR